MFKKIILKSFIILSILISIYPSLSYAGVIKIDGGDIKTVSIDPIGGGLTDGINTTGFSILSSIKTILLGIFIFYMVYAGAKMIMSMGTDEEKIKSAKRQIWYSIIGVIFISMPGTIYEAFFNNSKKNTSNTSNWSEDGIGTIVGSGFGIFLNYIVGLLEILIFFTALFIFIFTGIKLILGGKDSKVVGEAKMKILYSIIALILVGFIEVWRGFAFSGNIQVGAGIFSTIANLLLFIAPLIGLFFLTLAGYYYITSGGDKEKVKKAKDIIIYILLGTLIFLASYTILLEINTFIV
ncbi:MAG: hypothetical protein WC850_03525 [Candidatus Gracilibacteria bacterium]